jgi:hypothetical protein
MQRRGPKVVRPKTFKQIELKKDYKPFDLSELFTSLAYNFIGGCLVVCADPLNQSLEFGKKLLEECPTAAKIISQFNNHLSVFERSVKKISSNTNKEARQLEEQNAQDFTLKLNFPEIYRINSSEHVAKYVPSLIRKTIDQTQLPHGSNETLPLDLNIPDEVMLLLFAGVGIYAPSDYRLSETYTKLVIQLATEGKLSFMISDESICYGANYSFNHVMVFDNVAKNLTIGTLFQLAGRAGRVGTSYKANFYVSESVFNLIIDFIHGKVTDGSDIIAENLIKAFEAALERRSSKHEQKILEEQKAIERAALQVIKQKQLEEQNQREKAEKERLEKLAKEKSAQQTWQNNQRRQNESRYEPRSLPQAPRMNPYGAAQYTRRDNVEKSRPEQNTSRYVPPSKRQEPIQDMTMGSPKSQPLEQPSSTASNTAKYVPPSRRQAPSIYGARNQQK